MSYEATHELCCKSDQPEESWKIHLSRLRDSVSKWWFTLKRIGIKKPFPGLDARTMADIGLGKFGSDLTDPALRNVAIRRELATLEKMDRFGR